MSAPESPAPPASLELRDYVVSSLFRQARWFAAAFRLNAYDLLSEACLRAQADEVKAWSDKKPDG